MKNILTIDFDIIMYPCIDFYNHRVPQQNWEELQLNPLMGSVYGDLKLYKKLTELLLYHTNFLSKDDFIFIECHEDVVNYLPNNEDYYITNIDQHHDVAYNECDSKNRIKHLTCANWVKYCYDNDMHMKGYNWWNSLSSQFPIYEDDMKFINDIQKITEINLKRQKFDKIIICLSKPWTPPNYRELFYNWMNIIGAIYNNIYKLN